MFHFLEHFSSFKQCLCILFVSLFFAFSHQNWLRIVPADFDIKNVVTIFTHCVFLELFPLRNP